MHVRPMVNTGEALERAIERTPGFREHSDIASRSECGLRTPVSIARGPA
ncbi:MAG: hypothetical protein M3Y87_32105 [Myxococcota bacterium]|nr:hypothetical protein [Myxococcota bacterium]